MQPIFDFRKITPIYEGLRIFILQEMQDMWQMEDPTDVCRETDRCSSTERPEISVDLNRLLFAAKTIQEFCTNRDFSLVKLSKHATIRLLNKEEC